jgi:AbrB family looped-hinge helix DNA binding protein
MNTYESKRMDDLGRIPISKAIRRELGWDYGDEMEFQIVDGGVLIKKKEVNDK